MTSIAHRPFAAILARRLRQASGELTARWLDRIDARVSLEAAEIFPSQELLEHVPGVITGIADYLENPADEIGAQLPAVAKAMELGELRHAQGFDAYQILKEYELLGGVLFAFLSSVVDEIDESCSRGELLQCMHRVFRAVEAIQQVTMTRFLRLAAERVQERESRLRGFNRMVSHELKNRLGAILGAHALLTEGLEEPKRERFLAMIGENAEGIRVLLDNLTSLSRLDRDTRHQRNVELPAAAREAARQLREMARANDVRVQVDDHLPPVEVNAAVVELCLSNYISNAIKYSDPRKPERWVRVSGRIRDGRDTPSELVLEVRDNGLGVPPEARDRLFERFFRAHTHVAEGIEGTGLGLSIVRETVRSFGGRAWAEFEDDQSIFALALPCRRAEDCAAVEDAELRAAAGDRAEVPDPTRP